MQTHAAVTGDRAVLVQHPLARRSTADEEDVDDAPSACDGDHRRVRVRRDVDRPGAGEVLLLVALRGGPESAAAGVRAQRGTDAHVTGRALRRSCARRGGRAWSGLRRSTLSRGGRGRPAGERGGERGRAGATRRERTHLAAADDGDNARHVVEPGKVGVREEGGRVVVLQGRKPSARGGRGERRRERTHGQRLLLLALALVTRLRHLELVARPDPLPPRSLGLAQRALLLDPLPALGRPPRLVSLLLGRTRRRILPPGRRCRVPCRRVVEDVELKVRVGEGVVARDGCGVDGRARGLGRGRGAGLYVLASARRANGGAERRRGGRRKVGRAGGGRCRSWVVRGRAAVELNRRVGRRA